MVEIHHHRRPSFRIFMGSATGKWPDDFIHVASVNSDNLEHAFASTQHIHGDWTTGPDVVNRNRALRHIRSTSVGDVLVKDGKRYLVDVFGFKELSS